VTLAGNMSYNLHDLVGLLVMIPELTHIHKPESTKITEEHSTSLIFSLHTPSLVFIYLFIYLASCTMFQSLPVPI
jgi:hypothetical protein